MALDILAYRAHARQPPLDFLRRHRLARLWPGLLSIETSPNQLWHKLLELFATFGRFNLDLDHEIVWELNGCLHADIFL